MSLSSATSISTSFLHTKIQFRTFSRRALATNHSTLTATPRYSSWRKNQTKKWCTPYRWSLWSNRTKTTRRMKVLKDLKKTKKTSTWLISPRSEKLSWDSKLTRLTSTIKNFRITSSSPKAIRSLKLISGLLYVALHCSRLIMWASRLKMTILRNTSLERSSNHFSKWKVKFKMKTVGTMIHRSKIWWVLA